MKLPKVGEKFYWKDIDNVIYEDICLKIEGEDISTLETMFFISLTKNGGGCFVTESDIVDSNSDEVKNFKKEQAQKKVKEISDYISQKEVYDVLLNKLTKEYDWNEANRILNVLVSHD